MRRGFFDCVTGVVVVVLGADSEVDKCVEFEGMTVSPM